MLSLIIAESVLLIVVLIVLPILAFQKAKNDSGLKPKGLALPAGSVRSMLALMVVGSLVVLIVFGGPIMKESENFAQAVAALTGIAGSILGFYFGTRSQDNNPNSNNSNPNNS